MSWKYKFRWLCYILSGLCILDLCKGDMIVELRMPRYVEYGRNATLHCIHNRNPEVIYKVEWLKAGRKIFQFVKGRSPPYRNFSIVGADLDLTESNDKHIKLTYLDFAASGEYTCEVSLDAPIYTMESQEQELTVILSQKADPKITFEKPMYTVGEVMVANCTTAPARPPPHITWYINDQKVKELLVKTFSPTGLNGISRAGNGISTRGGGSFAVPVHGSPSVSQLSIEVSELHAGEDGTLRLTCVATIPGYLGHDEKYADIRTHTITIDVVMPDSTESSTSDRALTFHSFDMNPLVSAAVFAMWFHSRNQLVY